MKLRVRIHIQINCVINFRRFRFIYYKGREALAPQGRQLFGEIKERRTMGFKCSRFLILLFASVPLLYFWILVRSNRIMRVSFQSEKFNHPAPFAPSASATFDQIKPFIVHINNTIVRNCEIIHVALVVAGYNASRAVATLIKSMLFFRKNPMHLHLITDSVAQKILRRLFESWKVPQLKISFYSAENSTAEIDWVPNKHYSGVYGLLKVVMFSVLPMWLDKVIVLDCDLVFASDVGDLWATFDSFQPNQAIGLVEEQSDWYLGKLLINYQPWPALGRGFNTGVIAMDLKKLRSFNWSQLWRLTTEEELISRHFTSLADQDIFNAVFFHQPQLVHLLQCNFNVQLSDNTRSELCYAEGNNLKIVHWNSPKKLEVKNRHSKFFRNLYNTFAGIDGNLFRHHLLHCNDKEMYSSFEESQLLEDYACLGIDRMQIKKYRTHLFYFDFEPGKLGENDITWIAELSTDGLDMIEPLARLWSGPISLAVYLSDAEANQFQQYILESDFLNTRKNIAYHVVYKQGLLYPSNVLRNVALDQVQTPYVFLGDIYILPMPNMYLSLQESIQSSLMAGSIKALVVPAFEALRYRVKLPRSKANLISDWDVGNLFTYRYHDRPSCHAPTNFSRWRTATTPYKVEWEYNFEPYIVVKQNVTRYDERFVSPSWSKGSHIMELHAENYEFHVLPNAFVVHLPHISTPDILKYSTSSRYQKCAGNMKLDFIRNLKQRYNFTVTF